MRALGLTRVNTRDQEQDGYGLLVQAHRTTDSCRDHGWELLGVEGDGAERGSVPLGQRPGLVAALAAVRNHEDEQEVAGSRHEGLCRLAYATGPGTL